MSRPANIPDVNAPSHHWTEVSVARKVFVNDVGKIVGEIFSFRGDTAHATANGVKLGEFLTTGLAMKAVEKHVSLTETIVREPSVRRRRGEPIK